MKVFALTRSFKNITLPMAVQITHVCTIGVAMLIPPIFIA